MNSEGQNCRCSLSVDGSITGLSGRLGRVTQKNIEFDNLGGSRDCSCIKLGCKLIGAIETPLHAILVLYL